MNTFQKQLHKEIPLTKDMGVEIKSFEQQKLILCAPLANNINDKGSVFGGSSSACMIIAGWSLIKLSCLQNDINKDIVIHHNKAQWLKPSYEKLHIEAQFEKPYDFKKISAKIAKSRHKRINCVIKMFNQENELCASMQASFVILP